jgi:hypothetical protein
LFAHLHRQGTHPRTAARQAGARLRRLAAALVPVAVGLLASAAVRLLASAATIPAASASDVSAPAGSYARPKVAAVPAYTGHALTTGGVAGWQIIILIALGAALVAAAVTGLGDRAPAVRRAALLRRRRSMEVLPDLEA